MERVPSQANKKVIHFPRQPVNSQGEKNNMKYYKQTLQPFVISDITNRIAARYEIETLQTS